MPIYGFDADSAKRIGQTVRLVEGGRTPKHEASGAKTPRAAVGVRCMLGTISTAAWDKGSSGTVTLYSGEPGSEASVETLTAYNYVADIPASTTSGRYVALSNNGYGWIVIESESSVSLSTAQATYVVGVDVAASLNTATCSVTVTKTVTTASIIYATI